MPWWMDEWFVYPSNLREYPRRSQEYFRWCLRCDFLDLHISALTSGFAHMCPRKTCLLKPMFFLENPHLVGGLVAMFYFPINILGWDVLIPIDEVHHFSGRGGGHITTNQLWSIEMVQANFGPRAGQMPCCSMALRARVRCHWWSLTTTMVNGIPIQWKV